MEERGRPQYQGGDRVAGQYHLDPVIVNAHDEHGQRRRHRDANGGSERLSAASTMMVNGEMSFARGLYDAKDAFAPFMGKQGVDGWLIRRTSSCVGSAKPRPEHLPDGVETFFRHPPVKREGMTKDTLRQQRATSQSRRLEFCADALLLFELCLEGCDARAKGVALISITHCPQASTKP